MESVDFLAICTCIYSTSRERKRLFGCCFHPRPGFRVGKISQCAWPGLTKAQHGCCGSLSSTNLQHVRATACFSRGFWLRAATRSKHSRRFPPFHLKNRRTFSPFTTHHMC